jgi:hypothetical protein
MTGYAASYNSTRVAEGSVLLLPTTPNVKKRAIIYAHGATAGATQVTDVTNQPTITRLMGLLAQQGYVVFSSDFGGSTSFGDDACATAFTNGWNFLKSSGLCAQDSVIVIGASMGFMSASRFAADNPTLVAGMVGLIPAMDIEDIRNRNVLGLRDPVNTAWGLTAGSSMLGTAGPPVPPRGVLLGRLSAVSAINTRLYYSLGDTAVPPAGVTTYASGRPNVSTVVTSQTADHGEGALTPVQFTDLLSFVQSVAGSP